MSQPIEQAVESSTSPSPYPAIESPVYSMTGFARVSGRISDAQGFTLSIKSVNHRFFDPHLRLPSGSDSLEMALRRALKQKIVRGHVELTLTLERAARVEVSYNRELVSAYLAAFHAAANEHGLIQEPNLNDILGLPGILSDDAPAPAADPEAVEAAVMAALDGLIAALNTMRAQEGESLANELRACLSRLESLVNEIAKLREDVRRAYFERVSQRLSTLLNGNFEPERVLQEAALLADRSDVEEEIARMHTHIAHFRSLLEAGGEIGKKADFLLQEMNREANTLLSKTGGVAGNGTHITELGLGIKAEIEKAREQVQNLE